MSRSTHFMEQRKLEVNCEWKQNCCPSHKKQRKTEVNKIHTREARLCMSVTDHVQNYKITPMASKSKNLKKDV